MVMVIVVMMHTIKDQDVKCVPTKMRSWARYISKEDFSALLRWGESTDSRTSSVIITQQNAAPCAPSKWITIMRIIRTILEKKQKNGTSPPPAAPTPPPLALLTLAGHRRSCQMMRNDPKVKN
mmetsp:Transcript_1173/g.2195  ORF Transcript_1173/g.2195 Transcript_1173/m.2195 type:complete len:123 (+) Transcript_1173:1113-1481(+)